MKKNYLKVVPVILLVAGVGSFFFYWYQLRPAWIKHECSWVKIHADLIPEKVGMTEEELKTKGMIKECPPTPSYTGGVIPPLSDRENGILCNIENQKVINENKSQEYVPAKDWYEKANKDEYSFCLHDKGL